MKTALVTGASSGIGAETVKGLLAAGYCVYAGARRMERMQPLEELGARRVSLDVTDDASMQAAVEAVSRDPCRVDLLVNAAGYGSFGALEDVPQDEARRQFDVNVFEAARLIQLVLPAMRARRSGRIINISSIGGKIGEPFACWYHATKFAVEGLSNSLRMELHPFGIDVVVIEPGATQSEWSGIAREGLIKQSGDSAYADAARSHAKIMKMASESALPSPPSVVAKTIVRAAQARKPRTRYAVAGGARMLLLMRRILSDRAFDAVFRLAERWMTKPGRNRKAAA